MFWTFTSIFWIGIAFLIGMRDIETLKQTNTFNKATAVAVLLDGLFWPLRTLVAILYIITLCLGYVMATVKLLIMKLTKYDKAN